VKLKTLLSILLLNLALLFGAMPGKDSVTITVTIDGFRNRQGMCRLLVFENKKGFPDSKEYATLMLSKSINKEIVEFSFTIAPGNYAIAILHDENSNETMDKTWYGKPKEGLGASKNPKSGFGPPKFDECAVNLNESNNHIKIKLIYI